MKDFSSIRNSILHDDKNNRLRYFAMGRMDNWTCYYSPVKPINFNFFFLPPFFNGNAQRVRDFCPSLRKIDLSG